MLERLEFQKIHQRGSHVRYKHTDSRSTVVPVHGNETLGKGLINKILKQVKLSREEYDVHRRRI
ncbi:MAG: addiction module toxin, HicA family [Nitrosopumilus sp. B06]|nr:MAG: addiction module toxin, HicA family [Nitrosopumilus sp. B06]